MIQTKNRKKILFVGPVLTDIEHFKNIAASSATSEFLKNWFNGVSQRFKIIHINFYPDRIFPRGMLIARSRFIYNNSALSACYLNFFFLSTISKALSIAACVVFGKLANPSCKIIIFYNWHYYYLPAYLIAHIFRLRKIVIQADYKIPSMIKERIYMNHNEYAQTNSMIDKNIFFPGFIRDLKENYKSNISKIVAYAGGYGNASSISQFIQWYLNTDAQFHLHLFGRIDKTSIELIGNDDRVKIFGYLKNDELDSKLKDYQFFIEPRNEKYNFYNFSFPSKILFYRRFNGIIFTNSILAMSPGLRRSVVKIDENYELINNYMLIEYSQYEKIRDSLNEEFDKEMKLLTTQLYEFLNN